MTSIFTPEELEEIRRADEEIDREEMLAKLKGKRDRAARARRTKAEKVRQVVKKYYGDREDAEAFSREIIRIFIRKEEA